MALFNKFAPGSRAGSAEPYLMSIVENINNILNTKKDYGSFLQDFGIRDLNEYSSREDISIAVIEEVKQNIKLYEPRVELVNITMEQNDDPFVISFTIDCIVLNHSRAIHLIFDTFFNKFHVKDTW
jgi:type VI secretion system lysozyme-like protein